MTDFSVVIPARYASSRLPGKPLLDIAGQSMIERVYHQAQLSRAKRVIVATDDQRIYDAVRVFGGDVCMTSSDHQSGTDRLQEVVQRFGFDEDELVVNVQGDEPLIPPEVINQVAENLAANPQAGISTLAEALTDLQQLSNPHVVKVVADQTGMALYFSRAGIPFARDGDDSAIAVTSVAMRHIGIYAYRVALLNQFVRWEPAPLEKLEALEQLRAMWYGVRIHVANARATVPAGIDTPDDLQSLRLYLQQNGDT